MENSQNLSRKERRELQRQEKTEEIKKRIRKRIFRRVFLWSGVVLGLVAIIWGMVKLSFNYRTSDLLKTPVSASTDNIKGSPEAKVVVVEYSDFECPACKYYASFLKQASRDFGGDLALVFRHFPLPQHQNSEPAARAAEAAGKQKNFWEMADLLFENQDAWANEDKSKAEEIFAKYAESLGLDKNKFLSDFNSAEAKNKVENARQDGLLSQISATPTLFINGERIQNPPEYKKFSELIKTYLGKAEK